MVTRRDIMIGGAAVLSAPFISGLAYAQNIKVRRDLTTLSNTDPFFDQYRAAVKAMHDLDESDLRSWRSQALIHAMHCPHGEIGFAPWHRIYLANFEAICGELIGDPAFALPYWNWSANNGRLPSAFLDGAALDVHSWNDRSEVMSPLWGQIDTVATNAMRADFGLLDSPDGGVFQASQIEDIKRQSIFDIFWRRLEGSPHNTVHVITGIRSAPPWGHMLNGMSPLDPCFWLHHCNVDRIWAEWQAAGNVTPPLNDVYSGFFVDGSGNVRDFAAQDYVDHRARGFTYDTVEAVPAPPRPDLEAMAADLEAQQMTIIGSLSRPAPETVRPNIATVFDVEVADLVPQLSATRLFRAIEPFAQSGIAFEGKRVLARLKGVVPTAPAESMVAKVFVNCGYLTPTTKYTDPLYAGSFAFLGTQGEHAQHMAKDFYIDITGPLRRPGGSLFRPDRIKVQVMAAQLGSAEVEATFTIEGADIITV